MEEQDAKISEEFGGHTMKAGKSVLFAGASVAVAAAGVGACWQGLIVRSYTEITNKVSSPVRLAVLTDLHSSFYGKGQKRLLRAIQEQQPDLLLLVGDIVDDLVPVEGAKQLLSVIGIEYPCYYVAGNHEHRSGRADSIKSMIRSYGVTVLEGSGETVEVNAQKVQIYGVDDPEGFGNPPYVRHPAPLQWKRQLRTCRAKLDGTIYAVLLSHRPELAKEYRHCGFDLVVAGHAHGGQVRIPGIVNGLLAPNQGLFPKYVGGRYALGETAMIVSRGLCRNHLPRVFNPPELVVIDLRPAR